MNPILQLRAKIATWKDESQAILDKCKTENRDLIDDDRKGLDERKASIEAAQAEIKQITEDDLRTTFVRSVSEDLENGGREHGANTATDENGGLLGDGAEKRVLIPAIARFQKTRHFASNRDAYASGRWVAGAFGKNEQSRTWCREHGVGVSEQEARVMGEAINSTGGVLVPEEINSTFVKLRESRGRARQLMANRAMQSDVQSFPIHAGGLTAFYVAENEELTASDQAWNQAEIVGKKLGVLNRMSSELTEDAMISMADEIVEDAAYATADKEDRHTFNGDGGSTFGGFTGITKKLIDGKHTASLHTLAAGAAAPENVGIADLLAMHGQLPDFVNSPVWVMSKPVWAATLARLADAAGGATMTEKVEGVAVRPTFMGAPVIFVNVMTKTLTDDAGVVILMYGDFQLAGIFGDRRALRMKQSDDRYMEFDQRAIMTTSRSGINWHSLGDTSDAGPVIGLVTGTVS